MGAQQKGRHSKLSATEKSWGLESTPFLCRNAMLMLSVDICVQYGLFNGAVGKVIDIIYRGGTRTENSLPDAVMVEFPNYSGPAFIFENPKVVPIFPAEGRIDCVCHYCKRKQVSLRLGWATTVYRCQGMAVGKGEVNMYIVISPCTRLFDSLDPEALFVALSRAKSPGDDYNVPDFSWHPNILVNEYRF